MNKRELKQLVGTQLRLSAGWDGDAVSANRTEAQNYYFQRKRGDEVAGRSDVVSGDLSSMVESTLAQMMNAFGGPNIAEYTPLGMMDATQAKLESSTVNYLVMGRNNGFVEIAQAVKDALMCRNGLMKIYVEYKTRKEQRRYRGVMDPSAAAELTNIPGSKVTISEYSPKTGTLSFSVETETRRFCVHAVPPENFLFYKDWNSYNLQNIPFCAERHIDSRADLVAKGWDREKVDKLTAVGVNYKSDEAARRPRSESSGPNNAMDRSQDRIEWFECYVLMEASDGTSERRKIAYTQKFIFEDEPYLGVPYVSGCVFINPHRFTAISLHDKLKSIQDINTGLLRALLDGLNATMKNRAAYLDNKVNPDDLADGRINGNLRVKGVQDVRSAIMPFQVPDTSANVVAAMSYINKMRSEMGGASLDLATGQMQLNDRLGSQGLDRAYSVMEQLAELMTRMIGATLIWSVFMRAHEVLRSEYQDPIPVEVDAEWKQSIPAQWPPRDAVTVNPGMSPGERTRRSMALLKIIEFQMTLAEKGMEGVLVDVNGFYEAVLEWARLNDVKNPQQYFISPRSPQSQEALKAKGLASQEQKAMQQALMDQALNIEKLKTALDKYKADQDTQFKYWKGVLDSEVAEAQIVGSATQDLVKARLDRKAMRDGGQKANGASGEGVAKQSSAKDADTKTPQ